MQTQECNKNMRDWGLLDEMSVSQLFPLRKHAHVIYRFLRKDRKSENFQLKIFDIFLILAQNIDCGYTLEPPR